MGNMGLDRAKQEQIVELHEEDDLNQQEIAKEVGVSDKTVRKYSRMYENGEWQWEGQDSAERRREEDSSRYTADPPPGEGERREGPNYADMTKKEFVEYFFDKRGHGVYNDFAARLADSVEVRDQLPDSDRVIRMLMEDATGISNRNAAEMIGENYAAARRRYYEENREEIPEDPGGWGAGPGTETYDRGETAYGDGGGGGYDQEGYAQQGRQQGRGRRRDGRGQGGRQRDRQRDRGGGRQRGQGQQPQQQPHQGGQAGQFQDAINELKETQALILQQLGNDQNGADTLKDQVEQVAEISDTLERLQGRDGQNDDVQELQKQIESIRNEVARSEGEGQPVQMGGGQAGGSELAMIANLAARDDMDAETLSVLADSMGVTDPEVKKAEYEFKKTDRQLENRRELLNEFFDNVGEYSGDLISTAMEQLGDDEDSEDQSGGLQPAESEGTTPDDSPGRSTEFQVVGEDHDAGGGSQREQSSRRQQSSRRSGSSRSRSPARERLEQNGGGESAGRGLDRPGGGIQSPPDQQAEGFDGCQYIGEEGVKCGEPTVEGEPLCEQHVDLGG